MLENWLDQDHKIYLPALCSHMGYELYHDAIDYKVYSNKRGFLVVICTEGGYKYYHTGQPQTKLGASDLVREYVSRVEGFGNDSIWEKINDYYAEILVTEEFLLGTDLEKKMKTVSMEFNHFHSYVDTFKDSPTDFYKEYTANANNFKDSILVSKEGKVLFPLRNLANTVCGYFIHEQKVVPLGESAVGNSLWYSSIPEKINWLIIFKDPLEALAFDKKFQLENAVYLALGEINYQTTKILFQLQRLTKVKKLVMTFTGSKRIEGYLRDLHFFSFINDSNFQLSVNGQSISVRFKMEGEKPFLSFFKKVKRFNEGLSKSFLKFNKALDQHLLDKYSILISKDNDGIKVRVPLEVNAIKYFVWCYHKNYLNKSLEILKPKYPNWYMEWEAGQSIQLKGKEVNMEEYRIAL